MAKCREQVVIWEILFSHAECYYDRHFYGVVNADNRISGEALFESFDISTALVAANDSASGSANYVATQLLEHIIECFDVRTEITKQGDNLFLQIWFDAKLAGSSFSRKYKLRDASACLV